jgi:effector-binding domain-containing protein
MAPVKVEKRKPLRIAYYEHVGGYGNIPFDKVIPRLYEWAKKNKVMPGFYPMGIYMTDPKTTPPEKCLTWLAISFKGEGKPEGDIRIKDMPEMTVAAYSHKGPSSEYQKSYDTLTSWILANGYTVAGPPMEIYSKKPEMVDGQMILYSKILFPIMKLRKP